MLTVDKVLSPNEEITYTFTHRIPSNIPPTYDGTIAKVYYDFIIGANKQNSIAKVVKIPIRVLPNVTCGLIFFF